MNETRCIEHDQECKPELCGYAGNNGNCVQEKIEPVKQELKDGKWYWIREYPACIWVPARYMKVLTSSGSSDFVFITSKILSASTVYKVGPEIVPPNEE